MSFDVPHWPYEVDGDGFHLTDEKDEIECKKLDPKPCTGKGQATTTTHTSQPSQWRILLGLYLPHRA